MDENVTAINGYFDTANQMKCPSYGECGGIDYLYIGDRDTRIGYFQLWCNKCLKGVHISSGHHKE